MYHTIRTYACTQSLTTFMLTVGPRVPQQDARSLQAQSCAASRTQAPVVDTSQGAPCEKGKDLSDSVCLSDEEGSVAVCKCLDALNSSISPPSIPHRLDCTSRGIALAGYPYSNPTEALHDFPPLCSLTTQLLSLTAASSSSGSVFDDEWPHPPRTHQEHRGSAA